MDALQTIIGILDSLGPGLVTLIVIIVALILIWLIIRASRRGAAHVSSDEQPLRSSRYAVQPVEPEIEHVEEDVISKPVPPEMASPAEAIQTAETLSTGPQVKVEVPVMHAAEAASEPEDSVLHRHYDAEQAAKKAALADPYPTDSVLRRHYDASHKIQLDTGRGEINVGNDSASVKSQAEQPLSAKAGTIEPTIQKEGQAGTAPIAEAQIKEEMKAQVPQDSVLKRHFISQLRADIVRNLTPRPTDSVLQRHYDALVQCELEKRLHC